MECQHSGTTPPPGSAWLRLAERADTEPTACSCVGPVGRPPKGGTPNSGPAKHTKARRALVGPMLRARTRAPGIYSLLRALGLDRRTTTYPSRASAPSARSMRVRPPPPGTEVPGSMPALLRSAQTDRGVKAGLPRAAAGEYTGVVIPRAPSRDWSVSAATPTEHTLTPCVSARHHP